MTNQLLKQQPIEAEVVNTSDLQAPSVTSLGDVMTTAQLKASTRKAQEQRAIITTYVRDHLVKGVDYGQIGTFKKEVLFKPGQEKIFSLMNLTSRLEKDSDTIDMIGDGAGVVAYICRVYRKGEEIAQGRGAAKVGENSRDINSTIKIAEKRARMDACLSLGFSEFFTQDLEDPEYRNTNNVAANQNGLSGPATDKQRTLISKKLEELGVDSEDQKDYLILEFGVEIPLTKEDASLVIGELLGTV
jgi:hypothetical protein